MSRDEWGLLVEEGAGTWWATVVAGLVAELADRPRPEHSPAQVYQPRRVPRCRVPVRRPVDRHRLGERRTSGNRPGSRFDSVGVLPRRHRANASVRRPLSAPRRSDRAPRGVRVRYGMVRPGHTSSTSTVDGPSTRPVHQRRTSGPNRHSVPSSLDRSPASWSTAWSLLRHDLPPRAHAADARRSGWSAGGFGISPARCG